MLSNTAETKPSPNVVCGDAAGRLVYRHHRGRDHQRQQEHAPLRSAPGTTFQSGRRHGVSSRMTPTTVAPMYGNASPLLGRQEFA